MLFAQLRTSKMHSLAFLTLGAFSLVAAFCVTASDQTALVSTSQTFTTSK
jgi:hypothetical protein